MSNNLLYTITSKKELNMELFYEVLGSVCNPASFPQDEFIRSNFRNLVIRALDSLGHCEFNFDNRQVYVCPPTLSLLPSKGLPKAVLCGGRTPQLISKLKENVKKIKDSSHLSIRPQSMGRFELPNCIMIEAMNASSLKEIAVNTEIEFEADSPAAWSLINFSVSIEDLVQSLKFEGEYEANWPKREFDVQTLTFSKSPNEMKSRYKLVEYKNPVDQQMRHLLWEGQICTKVDRDWGRYVILSEAGRNVLVFDQKHYILSVPLTVPLPCIIARALTLCSGFVPFLIQLKPNNASNKQYFLMYANITPSIANILSSKLKQELTSCLFDQERREVFIC